MSSAAAAAGARPAAAPASAAPTAPAAAAAADVPGEKVLVHAAKMALAMDKPIMLDYYGPTKAGTAFIGEDKETKEKILIKNREEWTSPIEKLGRAGDDILVVTENSIYVVAGSIKKKEISSSFDTTGR
jgi:hypothetical protein